MPGLHRGAWLANGLAVATYHAVAYLAVQLASESRLWPGWLAGLAAMWLA